MEYYRSEKISESITRIIDIAGVSCYLIEGGEKACLLDTCCGYGDIKEYIRTLTDKNVFVVLTHGHYDHTGGASLFDTVYMNPKDIPVIEKHNQNREYFFKIDKGNIESLKDVDYTCIAPLYRKSPLVVNDEMIFDLGGIHIQMIQACGHTPGMMCALVKEERTMFYGDACGMNVLLHDEYSSCVSEYLKSLNYLKNFSGEYDVIYRNHGSFTNEKSLLDNVIECCNLILQHKDDHNKIRMFDTDLYQAKKADKHGRLDGKKGNIIYALNKAY